MSRSGLNHTRGRALAAAAFAALSIAGAGALAQESPGAGEGSTPVGVQTPPADASARFATADELLLALERAEEGLESLSAKIRYMRDFGVLEGGETQEWIGDMHYLVDRPGTPAEGDGGAARRSFAVHFDTLYVGNEKRSETKTYTFDGEWFVEKLHGQRQMFKRRVVPPGERADPLRIGEGPFPVPIGQRRADMLARFDVELLPPGDGWPEGEPPAALRETYQLRLVPKEGRDEARDFKEIRIWYRHEDLLPRMAQTVNTDGGGTKVMLANLKRNVEIPAEVFDTSVPEGWDVDIEEFRRPL